MRWATAWNWKSALVSAVSRALIFFAVNAQAGLDAGVTAMQVEFFYRIVASGFYGALTQYFATMRNKRVANTTAVIVLPVLAHSVELAVHMWAATPLLGWSVAGSVAFSIVTTRFHLLAMRCGVMTVGPGSRTLLEDLRQMPSLIVAFLRVS